MNENMLKDALYYLDPACGNVTLEQQRGVLIGLVSGLMFFGWEGPKAIQFIMARLPQNYSTLAVPKAWWEFLPPGPLRTAIGKLPHSMFQGMEYTRSMLLEFAINPSDRITVAEFDLLVQSGYLKTHALHPGWYSISYRD